MQQRSDRPSLFIRKGYTSKENFQRQAPVSWSGFVVHEITSVSGESELFPVGIGQIKRNSIKTHGTSCDVTGELIARRYFLKQENEEIEN